MKMLLATLTATFLPTFLAAPTMGAGWFWDFGNGIGFAAFAGLVYLMMTSARPVKLRAHRIFGYGAWLVAIGHAGWFMLGDGAVVEFMKPGAPAYMWLGVASLLLLGMLVTVAVLPDRWRVHGSHAAFRYWHRLLAIATIATASYHIIVSNFYLHTWYQATLFVMLALVAVFVRRNGDRHEYLWATTTRIYAVSTVFFAAAFAVVRNLPA